MLRAKHLGFLLSLASFKPKNREENLPENLQEIKIQIWRQKAAKKKSNVWLVDKFSFSLCATDKLSSIENNYISQNDNQFPYTCKSVRSGPLNRLLLNALVAFSDLFAGSFK